MWRRIRIAVLLLILLFVALNTYFDRVYSTDWDIPLRVAMFPINGDGSDVAARFIEQLVPEHFVSIESFFDEESKRHRLMLERPVRLSLGAEIRELPPMLEPGAGALRVAAWSLRARYWAWSIPEPASGAPPDVRLFVLFHDPQRSPSLTHSVGLQKGLFGIVNVFADRRMAGSNDVLIAHELLHTLGATDKYDRGTNQPRHPDGFAEPRREPLYPQTHAELMGGRIPVSDVESEIPESLRRVVIGARTAGEIGWSE